jgi:DNA helicase-2/ATP-dependent DNA helicase PcrA
LIDFWEDNPNCFVVGDDDQSIYSFQGAKVSNMLEFKHRYAENITTIVLTENYRSSSAILKASDSLISNNILRLVNDDSSLSKKLTCGGANVEYPAIEPVIRQFSNQFH